MSMAQGNTRFRSAEEEEDDAVIQTAYARSRMKKTKGLVYLICVVLGLIIGLVLPFVLGATINPFLFPVWPLLFIPLVFGIAGLAVGVYFNYQIISMSTSEVERGYDIKRFSNGALMILVVGLVFTIFFATLVPSHNWLENIVDKSIGDYTKPVMGKQAQDFQFTPNDPLYLTRADLDVTALTNNTTCDFFVGEINAFENVNDTENISQIEGASLKNAYKYNSTRFRYNGKDFEADKSYVVRVYNYKSNSDLNVRIKIHREIDDFVIQGMMVLCLMFAVIGGLTFAMMQGLRVGKARPAAQPAGAPRADPRTRDAATMFKDMEQEVQTMFPNRPGGAQPRPGGQPRPGYGQPRPAGGRPAGPQRPAVVDGEVVVRPGGASREISVERPTAGVIKSIACPRCRTKFTYTKVEGQVIEIECPNCGKKGKVGAKTAPPTPRPTAGPAPGARPPQRPAGRRPMTPARPPAPAKAAGSPLDELIGAPATGPAAGPKKMKTLSCPRCKQKFTVEEKPRPFEIKCTHCGKTGMLR